MNTNSNNTLFIVAGAAGEIGTEFCKALSERGRDTIAVLRNRPLSFASPFVQTVVADLTDSRSLEQSFKEINFSLYSEVTFIHTIGTDKFDPRGYPHIQKMKTIDPEIYDTNVNTFKYPLRYLIERIKAAQMESGRMINLKFVLVGGIPDKYTPFVIEGFCEAKNLCREYIRSAVSLNPLWVSGLAVNVGSTITKSAIQVRPFADLAYWLGPEEVVKRSIEAVINNEQGFKEIEIFKHSPEFKRGYYEDKQALYEKWSRETGIK